MGAAIGKLYWLKLLLFVDCDSDKMANIELFYMILLYVYLSSNSF